MCICRGCKREPKKIVNFLLEQGWFIKRHSRHIVMGSNEYPGVILSIAVTTSDARAHRNAISQIRKLTGIDLRGLFGGGGYASAH